MRQTAIDISSRPRQLRKPILHCLSQNLTFIYTIPGNQNGSIIFDFHAPDAATVNSTAIYTNIYDKVSNPFRDGADITTNITLAAQRLGEEVLHVYTLGKHQIGLYYYSRTIRRALKYSILAALGFELQYVDRPRLDTLWSSRARNVSTTMNPNYFGTVQVSCNNFFVHIEKEQRSYTLLASFGLLGGVWSVLRGLYYYIFGTDQQRGTAYSWYFRWYRNQEPLYDYVPTQE
ncbi:3983_t:CDS:2 [Acaulospora morrowiae]|uniref:3983_t:CDS:1 n=1 Tax=Acaulospora morrowiae TaxID=94023 RepID=A0A9N8ZC35_9GLOM|nr:3983_t:CDS:2 [Acaulospora morrowiae]